MIVRLGESQSWEDARLAMISQDHHLLHSFQTLKYVNSKFFTNQQSGNANADFQICIVALLVPYLFVIIGFNEKTHAGNLRPSLSTITSLHSTLRHVVSVQWYTAVLIDFRHNHNHRGEGSGRVYFFPSPCSERFL